MYNIDQMGKLNFLFCVLMMSGCGTVCESGGMAAEASSPDGRNVIRIWTEPLAYEVLRDGVVVVERSEIGLSVNGRFLCGDAAWTVERHRLTGTADSPVYKKAKVSLAGNETRVSFAGWGVRIVARDDGVAYRFETELPGRIRVEDEKANLTIPSRKARCSVTYGCFDDGAEEGVPRGCRSDEIETGRDNSRAFVYFPLVYSVGGKHVVVTEADVFDYPTLNLKRSHAADAQGQVRLDSVLAGWPTAQSHVANGKTWRDLHKLETGGRWVLVDERADYLVETEGTRTFPWRAFILADEPSKFCEADLIFALARPCAAYDFSWVRPGKVAWDWWNAWDNKGEKAGCNTANYKRFIDFAARNGVEYVILDEGWSEKLNIWKCHPNVDVPEIIRYGNEKGVGIILWMAWAQAYGDERHVAEHFAALGAKGFKIDFINRGDADSERFIWKFAEECAKTRMVVDYHGAHHPTGLSRAFPNVLNYEGVNGLERMKGFRNEYDFMENDVRSFFGRMSAGPMDYTPGAMDNYPIGKYAGTSKNPGSVGTRCHQMALMAAYEAPLQMLCDAPSKYEANMECFHFMASVPTVWAETRGLGGTPDSFAAVARKSTDGSWYVAVVNNSEPRTFPVDTGFLEKGEWRMETFRDAPDSDVRAAGYVHEKDVPVRPGSRIESRLAPGGGVVMRFYR